MIEFLFLQVSQNDSNKMNIKIKKKTTFCFCCNAILYKYQTLVSYLKYITNLRQRTNLCSWKIMSSIPIVFSTSTSTFQFIFKSTCTYDSCIYIYPVSRTKKSPLPPPRDRSILFIFNQRKRVSVAANSSLS